MTMDQEALFDAPVPAAPAKVRHPRPRTPVDRAQTQAMLKRSIDRIMLKHELSEEGAARLGDFHRCLKCGSVFHWIWDDTRDHRCHAEGRPEWGPPPWTSRDMVIQSAAGRRRPTDGWHVWPRADGSPSNDTTQDA